MMKRFVLVLGITAVSVSCVACAPEGQRPEEGRMVEGPRMVEVDGRQVRIQTAGLESTASADPIVVFEAGFMRDGLSAWTPIIEDVARFAPVIAYDRAGVGGSEPDGARPTPEHVAGNLHDLLASLGADPPYVLVGHSLGGPFIRMFTAMYPDEVAGLVYIDPMDTPSAEERRMMDEAEGISAEDSRRRLRESMREVPGLTPSLRAELEVVTELLETHSPEFQVLPPIPDIPVSVILSARFEPTPSSGIERDCEPRECHRRYTQERLAWMHTLIADVTNGALTVVTNSGHFIQSDDPDLVVGQIRRVLDAEPPARVQVDVPEAVMLEYVGRYEGSGPQFVVTLEHGQLFAQLAGQPAAAIFAESETEFFYRVVDAQITFVRDGDGAVSELVLHQNGRNLRWAKVR